MNSEHMQIRADKHVWQGDGVNIYINDGQQVCVGLTMEPLNLGIAGTPIVHISDRNAQILMDDLWASGFRPTEGAGSAGAMTAVQKHLSDMRKITSKFLKVSL